MGNKLSLKIPKIRGSESKSKSPILESPRPGPHPSEDESWPGYFPGSQIFALTPDSSQFRELFTTPGRARSFSLCLPPKTPFPKRPQRTRTAKAALDQVNTIFPDIPPSDDALSNVDPGSLGCVKRLHSSVIHKYPPLRCGGDSDTPSSPSAVLVPPQADQQPIDNDINIIPSQDHIHIQIPTAAEREEQEREESFRLAALSFSSPLDVPYLVSCNSSSAYTLINNDDHPHKRGWPRYQDFGPHRPRTGCFCHWCELDRGVVRGRHEVNKWCFCWRCVETRRRVGRMRERRKREEGEKRNRKGGEVWGMVRGGVERR